jgi:PAS domain S-box-containing protein
MSTLASLRIPVENGADCQRQTAELNRTLLESLPQHVFFKDTAGAFVSVNAAFARDFGMAPEELIGKTDRDLFPKELAEKYRADDRRVMEARQTETLVEENVVAGKIRYVEVVKTPVIAADGEVLGILGLFTDVTERRRMELELAEERDLLHTLMDNIPDLIYFKDRESRFTRINRAQVEHLGVSQATEALGRSDADFYSPELARGFREDEQRIIETGEPLVGKAEVVTMPEGPERWMLTTKVPVRDGSGRITGIVGVSKDITAHVRAEAELKRTAEELARSNEELQQFAYVASHDLQEPLRMVASYTQLLARRYADRLDDEANEFIHYAVDGAHRMQGLINDLLAYSRVGTRAEEPHPVEMSEAFRGAVANLAVAIEETSARVTCGDLPAVTADPSQMVQLLQNLIGNALKFRADAAPEVRVDAQRSEGDWLFSVRDNGIGLDARYAERIFVIFQRLHARQEYPGSGIGLSICKKIVNRHGGRIWVESKCGEGATFYFTIPAVER